MKLCIIGSIKIDSKSRKKLFRYNLRSLEPISSIISWSYNIVGKHAEFCRKEIIKRYNQASITNDDKTSFYELVKAQIFAVSNQESEPLFFFWQEDHWFICHHKNLFLYLLDEFQKSKAELLVVTHLVELWEHKSIHKLISNKKLYKEHLVSLNSQTELWKKHPTSYLTTIPGIYKKAIVNEILEINKHVLAHSKPPAGFELHGKSAKEFLFRRSFIEMMPIFHVFREVFRFSKDTRSMDMREALQIIKLREKQERPPCLGIWRRIMIKILLPRVTLGLAKRRIKNLIK